MAISIMPYLRDYIHTVLSNKLFHMQGMKLIYN